MGSILLQYQWIVIFFGVFLILTGFKIIFAPEKPINPGKNPVIKLFRKFFSVTPTIEGKNLIESLKKFSGKSGVKY